MTIRRIHRVPGGEGNAGCNGRFHILIVADDETRAQNARSVCERLLKKTSADNVDYQLVTFAGLGDATTRAGAVEKACIADMIVVAAQVAAPPNELCTWVEAWLTRQRQPDQALVALIDGTEPGARESNLILAYLERVAVFARMAFFALRVVAPAKAKPFAEALQERANYRSACLEEALHYKPKPRWDVKNE
ncbi:MAG: hypothetical protein AB1705_04180 [Verrucomicrobiota bacterium]